MGLNNLRNDAKKKYYSFFLDTNQGIQISRIFFLLIKYTSQTKKKKKYPEITSPTCPQTQECFLPNISSSFLCQDKPLTAPAPGSLMGKLFVPEPCFAAIPEWAFWQSLCSQLISPESPCRLIHSHRLTVHVCHVPDLSKRFGNQALTK